MAKQREVFCKFCDKKFFRANGRYNEAKKFNWNQYCSKKCLFQDRIRGRMLACENCGKNVLRVPSAISAHNFCSQHCSAIASNKHRVRDLKMKVCLYCGNQYRKLKGNRKYCSMECRKNAESYTSKELIESIKKMAKKLKRVPAKREFKNIVDACVKNFGSWNKAILAAGLIPNRSDSQRMYKRTNTRALDGHLCDSISEALIDNWLFKNKISHKRDIFYPTTNHKADWVVEMNGQWIFIEYFGLAKDSKRYDRDIDYKKELCKINKIPLLEIYPQDLYPKNRLIDKLKFLCQGGESCTPDFRFPKPAS